MTLRPPHASELIRDARQIAAAGPWPFVTRILLEHERFGRFAIAARAHRKGLSHAEKKAAFASLFPSCLWMPGRLNWWIGVVFAAGSFLFGLGSFLSLLPAFAAALRLSPDEVNAMFFAGSVPFTAAAYLQLYQAANAPAFGTAEAAVPQRVRLFGWRPREAGWLACALQFAGTLLFNVNTFDALLPGLDWLRQDMLVWVPDLAGSVLFLVSGYLFLVEAGHAYWSWKPGDLTWLLNFANFLGCVAFMLSAAFAFVPPSSPRFPSTALVFTLLGAAGFFVGSALMLPETVQEETVSPAS